MTRTGSLPGFTSTSPGSAGCPATVGVTIQAVAGAVTPEVAPGSLERPDARRPATIWVVALGLEIGRRGSGRDHRVDGCGLRLL